MHGRRPIVIVSPIRQRDTGGVDFIIVVSSCTGITAACIYDTTVGKVFGPQILLHPTLVADSHGVIDVAIIVRHRGSAGTRLCVTGRLRIQAQGQSASH